MWRIMMFFALMVAAFPQEPFNDEDPREIIEKVMIYRLTQELDLTTEQALKFFPKLKDMRKMERDFNRERMEVIGELEKLVKDSAMDKEIEKVIEKYKDMHDKRLIAQTRMLDEIKDILTPLQQAKFLIFQERFEREIRELIKEVRKHKPPKR